MDIDASSRSILTRSNLLCVLGMHRSGTSVVTQFLHQLGAAVAPQLLGPMDEVNQEGFWEDRCVVDINERLLAMRDCRWFDCREAIFAKDGFGESQIRNEAIHHFKKNYATQNLSVVKDPRLCRLLPFWLDVWAAAAVNPIFIHVVRHPLAVVKSLQRRDKIPYEHGIVLWLLHTVEAMLYTSTFPGLVVIYDAFLQHPLDLAEALVSRYRVVLSGAEASWSEAARTTIRSDLRHNDNSIGVPLGLRELREFAVSLYEVINSSVPGGVELQQLEQWRVQLRQLLRSCGDEVAMLNRLREDLMRLSAENVRVGEMHSAALTVISEKDVALAYRDSVIAEKDVALAYRDSVIVEKDALIAERNQLIDDLFHLKVWRVVPYIMHKVRKT